MSGRADGDADCAGCYVLPAGSSGRSSPVKVRNRLREIRQSRSLTQAELASRIGVSRKTINTVENGVFTPSVALALALARDLGILVEDLFQLTDQENERADRSVGE
nr:helix-turn-helix transcriptional regulator [Acetobacter musti]